MNKPLKSTVLGYGIDNLSMQETLQRIEDIIAQGIPKQHVVVNAGKIVDAYRKPELKNIIHNCAIINADGMAVVWASWILGQPLKERVSGIDLMQCLIKRSCDKGYGVYFLGAQEPVVEKTVDVCKEKFPDLKICGYRNGYWNDDEEPGVVEAIQKSGAQILLVAISSPKKEIFLNKYLHALNVPFVMGVGGSFDVIAGLTKRAPLWMQRCGLEWLFRLIQEPGRLWRRYLIGNAVFVGLVAREWVKIRIKGISSRSKVRGRNL